MSLSKKLAKFKIPSCNTLIEPFPLICQKSKTFGKSCVIVMAQIIDTLNIIISFLENQHYTLWS